jgi:outer membrane protein TolC
MKLIRHILLGLLVSVSAGQYLQAQVRQLTLDNAVTLALEKNRDLQISGLEISKSAQRLREARGFALPTVEATGQYLHFLQRQVTFLPGQFAGLEEGKIATLRVGGTEAYVGNISLVQPLFAPNIGSGIRAAKIYSAISEQERAELQSSVITSVKKLYLDALITGEQLRLVEQSIVRNEQALKDSRSLLAQGRASRVDTLRAYVTIENLRPEIIRLRNGVEIAKTLLKVNIGMVESEAIELLDSLAYDGKVPVLSNEAALAEALKSRPEVSRLELFQKLSSEQIKTESSAYLPRLSAIGQVQTQSQANDLRLGNYLWPVSSYVGLQLSVPIFNGFRTAARVQQARITKLQSEKQLEHVQESIRAEVKVALSKVEESRLRIASQTQTVSTAELSYRITRDRWKQGISSRLELADAELALTGAKSNYLQSVYDYLHASVELDKALGVRATK